MAVVDGKLTIFSVKKAGGGVYACSVKNLLGQDFAVAQVTVLSRLKFIVTPPLKVAASELSNLMLNCAAQGSIEIVWKRAVKIFLKTMFFIQTELCFLTECLQVMPDLTHA